MITLQYIAEQPERLQSLRGQLADKLKELKLKTPLTFRLVFHKYMVISSGRVNLVDSDGDTSALTSTSEERVIKYLLSEYYGS